MRTHYWLAGLMLTATSAAAAPLDFSKGKLILGSPDSDAYVEFIGTGFTLHGSNSGAGTRSIDRFELPIHLEVPSSTVPLTVHYDRIEARGGWRPIGDGYEQRYESMRLGDLAQPFLQGRPLDQPLVFGVTQGSSRGYLRIPVSVPVPTHVLSWTTDYRTDDVLPFFDEPSCTQNCQDGSLTFASVPFRGASVDWVQGIAPFITETWSATWAPESYDVLREAVANPNKMIPLEWVHDTPANRLDELLPIIQPIIDEILAPYGGGDLPISLGSATIFAAIDSKDQKGGGASITFADFQWSEELQMFQALITLRAVPLPPAAAGLLAGLGVLGWLSRRRGRLAPR